MAERVVVWTFDDAIPPAPHPVRRWAEKFGYPHDCWREDEDGSRPGKTQYENHHLATEAAAWASMQEDRHARVWMANRDLVAAERAVVKAKEEALAAFRAELAVRDAFDEWVKAEGRQGEPE